MNVVLRFQYVFYEKSFHISRKFFQDHSSVFKLNVYLDIGIETSV